VKDHKTLILLGVDNLEELSTWKLKLESRNILHREFVEPDIGDQMTAIAVCPSEETRKVLSNLRLL
jgi:phage baseplate assembly protein gpV